MEHVKGKESNEMCQWNFLGETLYYLLMFDLGYNVYFEKNIVIIDLVEQSIYFLLLFFCCGIAIDGYILLSFNTELIPDRLGCNSLDVIMITPSYFLPFPLLFS